MPRSKSEPPRLDQLETRCRRLSRFSEKGEASSLSFLSVRVLCPAGATKLSPGIYPWAKLRTEWLLSPRDRLIVARHEVPRVST